MIPMLTAVTQTGVSCVHAVPVLKATVLPVQVKQLCINPSKCLFMQVMVVWYVLLQMFPSVTEDWMTVIQMQIASTILEATTVYAMLGSLEMDSHAQVCVHASSFDFAI